MVRPSVSSPLPTPIVTTEEACHGSHICENSGICQVSANGTHLCKCERPWIGEHCEFIWQNPCTEAQLRTTDISQFKDPWNRYNYIVCTDINVYHSLPCAPGTFFNEIYGQCLKQGQNLSICPLNYCQNEAECSVTDTNEYKCECKRGFTGNFCETNIDDCEAMNGNEVCGYNGRCVDQLNNFYCLCHQDMIGLNCNETILNPCTNEAVKAKRDIFVVPDYGQGRTYLQCTSFKSFVVSQCAEGLYWHQEELACTLEKPTVKSGKCMEYPCQNGGECKDVNGEEFECVCKSGFTGQVCEVMVDHCSSNPCQNGGRCLAFPGGYTCACHDKIVDDCCCNSK